MKINKRVIGMIMGLTMVFGTGCNKNIDITEEIIKENYNKRRRISRGIFVTNRGIKINADINGSLNILRKYIKKVVQTKKLRWIEA